MFYVAMLFAFLIVIFLLTMLVTLIAEAYDKIKEKAEDIFGRCREVFEFLIIFNLTPFVELILQRNKLY